MSLRGHRIPLTVLLLGCSLLVSTTAVAGDTKTPEWLGEASGKVTTIAGYLTTPTMQQVPGTVEVAGQRLRAVLYADSEDPTNNFMCLPTSAREVLAVNCRSPLPFTPDPSTSNPVDVSLTARDVGRLIASGSGAMRQPPGEQVLLSKPLIVYTDPSPRTLTTTVAGTPVELYLTPVSYTWDWGDGTTTTTTDPGATYPDQRVTHYYSATASNVVVTLTTSWDATFRPTGTTAWQPVTGQVTTTDQSDPFDIVRRVTVLTDTAEELQGH